MPDDLTYEDRVIRITELAGEDGVLDNLVFIGCQINGPAVVVVQGSTLDTNTFDGDLDAILWEVPVTRQRVVGAVLARNCSFTRCRFSNVGFAGPPEFIQTFRQASH